MQISLGIMILPRSFYRGDVLDVAKNLLGKVLVHDTSEGMTSGRIVETEAYCGPEDLAAHSARGRRTERVELMYGEKGHAYIYFIYGMYWCFNVTAGATPGKPEAVLVRALEPVRGTELMDKRRGTQNVTNLSNGPGKLCMAMSLTGAQTKADLTKPPLRITDAPAIPQECILVRPASASTMPANGRISHGDSTSKTTVLFPHGKSIRRFDVFAAFLSGSFFFSMI